MGVLTFVLKGAAKGLAKTKGDSPYWDVAHTIKQSPALVAKAAHGVKEAAVAVRDAPLPYSKTHSQKLISKLVADDRIPKLDPVVSAKVGVKELAKDRGVSNNYLEYLVQHVGDKPSIKMIRSYVQSDAADNLTANQRAELLIKCMEKLRYLDMIHQFFT